MGALLASPGAGWERELYAPSSEDHATGAEPLPSGGFVVFGHRLEVPAITGSDMAWTVVLDADGHVVSASQLDLTTSTWAGSCVTTSGDFVTHGLDYDPARHQTILRRRSDLTIRWWIEMTAPEDVIQGVIADASDGCFVWYRHQDAAGNRTFRVARLDASGAASWAIDMGAAAATIARLSDGGLLAAASAVASQPRLARLDSSGSVAWQAAGPASSTSGYTSLIEDADGSIVAVGDDGNGRPSWARWSADGRVLEATIWSLGTFADPFRITSLGASPSGVVATAVERATDAPVMIALGGGLSLDRGSAIEGGPPVDFARLVRGLPSPALLCRVQQSGTNQRDWLVSLDASFDPGTGCLRPSPRSASTTPLTPTTNAATWAIVPAPPPALAPFAAPEVPFRVDWRPHAGDAYEDDDSAATARPIDGSLPQAHDFCDDADDWVRYQADRGVDYTIEATPSGSGASVRVDVLAADATSVILSADPGATGTVASYRSIDRHLTYLRVGQADGSHGASRGYDLQVSGATVPMLRWSRAYDDFDEVLTIADTARGPVTGSWWHQHRLDRSGAPLEKDAGERRVCPARDGGWFELGGRGASMRVARMKPSGDLQWMRLISGSSSMPYDTLCEGSDGALWLAGGVAPSLFVARLLADGTPQWSATYSAPNAAHHVALGPTRDGGALLAASFTGGPAVIRFAPDGTPSWARALTGPLTAAWIAAIAESSDGGCLVSATPANALLNPESQLGLMSWIARLSPAGDVVWANEVSSGGYLHVIGGDRASAGGLLVCGGADLPGPRGGDGFVMSVREDGSLAWAKALDSGYKEDRIWCVRVGRDGTLLAGGRAGNVTPGEERWSAWTLRLGADGSPPTACDGEVRDVAVDLAPYALSSDPVVMSAGTVNVTTTPGIVARVMEAPSTWTRCIDGAVPGEVSPKTAITLLRVTNRSTFTWEAPSFSGADSFDVYRGDIRDLGPGNYGACIAQGLTAPSFDDPAEPIGTCWFYLVAGRNVFGTGVVTETSFGLRPSPTSTCP